MSRGTAARSVVVVVLGAAAVVCIGLGLRSPATPAASTAPRLATPVWSVRRVPQPVVDAAGVQRLDADLGRTTAGTDTCYLVDEGRRRLVARNPDRPLIPASTLKLITAAAALQTLGPSYRFTTTAVATARPVNGTVDRLYLVGGGDPVLSTPEHIAALATKPLTRTNVTTPLAKLADDVVARGVTSIPGGVWGDDSRYDVARTVPSWPASYRTEVGPLGALTVDGGFDRVSGTPVGDPALAAATELTRLLAARGVQVGPPGHASAPGNAVELATLASPPLGDLVAAALRSSDNLSMELITRELGHRVNNTGSTAAGTAAVLSAARGLGIPTDALHLVDGSGLDHGNRATCAALAATLHDRDRPQLGALADGLPVAAKTGTLATRFAGTPLAGRLAAKTGSLDGATGLVGLWRGDRSLDFAFLANGAFPEVTGIALREQVARILARYPDVPDADTLVPAPVSP
ncbi:MAG: D-alanyl-D-alanine carboxypeptidase [Acidimicrobiia bacterium]